MDLDGQLTQQQFYSSQVDCISNDFDVNEFELEEEQEEEDRIGDVVSSDSDDSDDDQGGRHAPPRLTLRPRAPSRPTETHTAANHSRSTHMGLGQNSDTKEETGTP